MNLYNCIILYRNLTHINFSLPVQFVLCCWQGLTDADFYKTQLIKLQNFITDPEFPHSEDIFDLTQRRLGVIFEIE
jgi:hypothetical protein